MGWLILFTVVVISGGFIGTPSETSTLWVEWITDNPISFIRICAYGGWITLISIVIWAYVRRKAGKPWIE